MEIKTAAVSMSVNFFYSRVLSVPKARLPFPRIRVSPHVRILHEQRHSRHEYQQTDEHPATAAAAQAAHALLVLVQLVVDHVDAGGAGGEAAAHGSALVARWRRMVARSYK